MRITVDTNVLISATFWKGDSEKIISLVEDDNLELIPSKEILSEYAQVLASKEITNKIKDKKLIFNRTIEKLITIARIVEPKTKVKVVKTDPDDNKIIECALAGKVDFILSMDKHLLDLNYKIPIVHPSEFIRLLRK